MRVIVLAVSLGMPSSRRISMMSSSGRVAQMALPSADEWTGTRSPTRAARRIVRSLSRILDVDDPIPVEDGQVHGLAEAVAQPLHDRTSALAEHLQATLMRGEEAHPQPVGARGVALLDIAAGFEGAQVPERRRLREADGLGKPARASHRPAAAGARRAGRGRAPPSARRTGRSRPRRASISSVGISVLDSGTDYPRQRRGGHVRVGIVGLNHESNTFLPTLTERGGFDVRVGEDVRARWAGTNHEVAGFLEGLERQGLAAVPVLVAVATPGGRIAQPTFDDLVGEMLEALRRLGPFDGILAAAHGAAVSERQDDADGEWLRRVRAAVGPDVPIVVVADAHANLSQAMLDACDALVGYRTNPHLDTKARGLERPSCSDARSAARCARSTRERSLRVAINITQQATAEPPLRHLYRRRRRDPPPLGCAERLSTCWASPTPTSPRSAAASSS